MEFLIANIKNVLIGIFLFWLLMYSFGFGGRDDTDSKILKKRSGLSLYTDYATGCQYIKGGLFGTTTPRLDQNGEHICIKPEIRN